jgi:hypothetical protein
MAKDLTVNNKTFSYPSPGEDPGWGEDSTAWAEEVTNVLSSVLGPGDILESTFTIPDDSTGDISGLSFDESSVRGVEIDYSVYRSGGSTFVESGKMFLAYDGSNWFLSRQFVRNDTGSNGDVSFDISSSGGIGQITYDSTPAYAAGTMKFKATVLNI